MVEQAPSYVIRSIMPGDVNMVTGTWIECLRHQPQALVSLAPGCKLISPEGKSVSIRNQFSTADGTVTAVILRNSQLSASWRALITSLIITGRVYVACSTEDSDTIFGYLVSGPEIDNSLHWVYVRLPYRGLGIATALMKFTFDSSPVNVTLRTSSIDKVFESWGLVYEPGYITRQVKEWQTKQLSSFSY